jgi:hypothetical protein
MESLPTVVVNMVFLQFLNLPDFGRWDSANSDLNSRLQMAEKLSNSGSSNWFPIWFDLKTPERSMLALMWFAGKRIIKHQNIDIRNLELCSSLSDKLTDWLSGLDVFSVLSVSLHCLVWDGEGCFSSLIEKLVKLLPNLVAVTFVKCIQISDENVHQTRKRLKHLEVFVKSESTRNSIVPGQPRHLDLPIKRIIGEDNDGRPVYILLFIKEDDCHSLEEYFLNSELKFKLKTFSDKVGLRFCVIKI